MDDSLSDRLVHLERTVVRYDAPPSAGNGVAVLRGTVPVLVSAPHAARHRRSGAWKREDEYTAALAHWLHECCGVHAMYTTHRIDPDPHDDDDRGHFKQTLADFARRHRVRLVIDLHGARGDRDFAVALGTIHGLTCQPYEQEIIAAFEAVGFSVNGVAPSLDRLAVNPARYAGGSIRRTVTRFAWHEVGVAAVQVELNAWARIIVRLPESYEAEHGIAPHFRGDPERVWRVVEGLRRVIELAS